MVLLATLVVVWGGPSIFADAQNVIGIDLGSEWIKIAVVQRSAGVSHASKNPHSRLTTDT